MKLVYKNNSVMTRVSRQCHGVPVTVNEKKCPFRNVKVPVINRHESGRVSLRSQGNMIPSLPFLQFRPNH